MTLGFTLGPRSGQNAYSGQLAGVAATLRHLPTFGGQMVVLFTSNQAVAQVLKQPHQQSRREYVICIYDCIKTMRDNGNTIRVVWIPATEENDLLKLAKSEARNATQQGSFQSRQFPPAQSTLLGIARAKGHKTISLPDKVGGYSKKVDRALPGKQTELLYKKLRWKERSMLSRLRTGMTGLIVDLFRVEAAVVDICDCGIPRETVEHFLFRCRKWTEYRREMLQCTDTHRGNLSFYLGGSRPQMMTIGHQIWKQ
jgi:hypothetical protein